MLEISDISFSYANKKIIDSISFSIQQGQHIAVIGESGCGKSTLLKLIYGLYDLDSGHIFFKNQAVLGPKFNLVPGVDNMKYLSQDFDLMPYITVAENVGKFISNIDKKYKNERVNELLEIVEMIEFSHVKAQFLSGGQQQRVALARAIALEPELLLLDEPFSHIDNFKKNNLRRNLFSYLKSKNISCIVASHDSTDSLSFSDKTIVIQSGTMIAFEDSKSLYNNPKSHDIASLYGEVNVFSPSDFPNQDVPNDTLLVYPNQLKLTFSESDISVVVKEAYFKGGYYLVLAEYKNQVVFFNHQFALQPKEKVGLVLTK
jgi:ABC-type Fe3+/spermidine/putrescine transport system ATPase subunit